MLPMTTVSLPGVAHKPIATPGHARVEFSRCLAVVTRIPIVRATLFASPTPATWRATPASERLCGGAVLEKTQGARTITPVRATNAILRRARVSLKTSRGAVVRPTIALEPLRALKHFARKIFASLHLYQAVATRARLTLIFNAMTQIPVLWMSATP